MSDADLRALDREFTASTTMTHAEYSAKRSEILWPPAQSHMPAPALSRLKKFSTTPAEKDEIYFIKDKFKHAVKAWNPAEIIAISRSESFRASLVRAARAVAEAMDDKSDDINALLLMAAVARILKETPVSSGTSAPPSASAPAVSAAEPERNSAIKAELETFEKSFSDAREIGDADAMASIANTQRFVKLTFLSQLDDAGETAKGISAASVFAMLVGQRDVVNRTFQIHVARRRKLEARIKALEERSPLAYAGTWSEAKQSNKGMFYTDHGSIWYCRETTRDRPGTSAHFQLAVKRGNDGKDAL